MLIARIATALVSIPLLVAVVWLGAPFLPLVLILVAYLAAREAAGLVGLPPGTLIARAASVGAAVLVLGSVVGPLGELAAVAIVLLGFTSLTLLSPAGLSLETAAWDRALGACLYVAWPLALIGLLRQNAGPPIVLSVPLVDQLYVAGGVAWVLVLLTTTWSVDTVAYVVGRAMGRHPFSPRLSPKKTWEGTVAGLAAGTIVFLAWSPPFDWPFVASAVVGLVGSCAAVLGDLVESALKRGAGLKDAGRLLPGHGGLLDRLDSLGFMAVVVFLWWVIVSAVSSVG